jgi:hypothetical protein
MRRRQRGGEDRQRALLRDPFALNAESFAIQSGQSSEQRGAAPRYPPPSVVARDEKEAAHSEPRVPRARHRPTRAELVAQD